MAKAVKRLKLQGLASPTLVVGTNIALEIVMVSGHFVSRLPSEALLRMQRTSRLKRENIAKQINREFRFVCGRCARD